MAEERRYFDDRQIDALLERLDRICAELQTLNKRLDSAEELQRITHQLTALNDSLSAIAVAALGREGPQVRRRRSA